MKQTKILLPETDIPKQWYNVAADLKNPPTPESNHAIRACIDEALRCKETGEAKTLFFNLSGHGHFDMVSYDKYLNNQLEDYEYPQAEIDAALERLPKVKGA